MYIGELGGGDGGEGGATFCDYALCPIFRRWELAAVLQVGPWLPPSPPPPSSTQPPGFVCVQNIVNLTFLKSEISKKVKGQEDFSRLFSRKK
jgi:hypothetical protein